MRTLTDVLTLHDLYAPRHARMYIPPRPSKRLLILFDGQNVFGDEGSFAGGWHAQEAIDRLPGTVERPLVLGVDHGHHHRNRELWMHLNALLDELIHQFLPMIRSRWDIESVILGGASLGGLAALAGHFRHPHLFRGALCLSPSFWYDQAAIFREIPTKPSTDARIYLDVGLKEGRIMHDKVLKMVQALQRCGFGEKQLMWRPDKRGNHNEKSWRRRLPKALRFMFKK